MEIGYSSLPCTLHLLGNRESDNTTRTSPQNLNALGTLLLAIHALKES
jgi:hypothetical protein